MRIQKTLKQILFNLHQVKQRKFFGTPDIETSFVFACDSLVTLLQIADVNGLFHFLSVQGDGRKKFKSIFALDFFDMNILSPGKQLGEFLVSLEFHSELPSIFASFVLSKYQWM